MRRMFQDWTLSLLLAAVAFAAVGWWRGRDLPEVETMAPPLRLAALDGSTLDLEESRGSVVVVNFWASWCPPCLAEVPEFARFAAAHPEVQVWGLAVQSGNEAAVGQAARAFGITWPVALADDATSDAWGVDTLPTTAVIGGDGRLAFVKQGAMGYEELAAAVR